MAELATSTYAPTENKFLGDVEKFAEQILYSAKSRNVFDDFFRTIEVGNGTTIEKAIVKMAEKYAFDPTGAKGFAQEDPKLLFRYSTDWIENQYEQTYRRNEVRKILMSGKSPEDFAGMCVTALTEGADDDDFIECRKAFIDKNLWKDYAEINGGRLPKDMKGVLTLARDMYDHIIATNDDSTEDKFRSTTPVENAVIVMPTALMNLASVTEWANMFHMEKADLLGRLCVYNSDDLPEEQKYLIVVCDENAFIRARRVYEIVEDKLARGGFINYYLTTSRLYNICGLFKGLILDCSAAAKSTYDALAPAAHSVTVTVAQLESQTNPAKYVADGGAYKNVIKSKKASVTVATATMGGTDIKAQVTASGNTVTANVPTVTGDIVITVS